MKVCNLVVLPISNFVTGTFSQCYSHSKRGRGEGFKQIKRGLRTYDFYNIKGTQNMLTPIDPIYALVFLFKNCEL